MGSNTCPICLEDIVGKIRASPDTCDHIFCLQCLEKWSKLGCYCPVDRKRYKKILNLDSSGTIQVKPRKRKRNSRVLYDISTKCEVCSKDNSPEILLLCDCCDLGFHMCCLSPPLKAVPAGSWICPTCDAVEKKLKDKKGISKEVEVEVIKSEIVEASKKNISEECDQVIADYEAISVTRNWDENVFCPNILDDTNSFNGIDKIFKTNNYETQSCKQNLSKYSKTYNLLTKKKNISKPLSQEQIHVINNQKLQSSNVDDMCLKNNISEDVNLLDQYLFEGGSYGYMKHDKVIDDDLPKSCDTQIQQINFNEDYKQIEFSGTNSLQPGAIRKNEINLEENVNLSLNGDNLQEGNPAVDKAFEEMQRNPKTLISENAQDLQSLHKSVSENSPKGTYNLNTEFLSENSKQMPKEKIHFSVFDKIDDIDASQKKYSEINSFINTVLSSDLHKTHCIFCKDMIFVKSQKYCKLCKLKHFKKSVKEKESQASIYSPGFSRFKNTGNSPVLLDSQKHSIKQPNISASERRRRSLLRTLRKMRNSNWMLVPSK